MSIFQQLQRVNVREVLRGQLLQVTGVTPFRGLSFLIKDIRVFRTVN